MPDNFVALVDCVVRKSFAGRLPGPEHDVDLVAGILSIPCFADQSETILDSIAAGLIEAIDCLRRERDAIWTN